MEFFPFKPFGTKEMALLIPLEREAFLRFLQEMKHPPRALFFAEARGIAAVLDCVQPIK
jgi:hypothetical protein